MVRKGDLGTLKGGVFEGLFGPRGHMGLALAIPSSSVCFSWAPSGVRGMSEERKLRPRRQRGLSKDTQQVIIAQERTQVP